MATDSPPSFRLPRSKRALSALLVFAPLASAAFLNLSSAFLDPRTFNETAWLYLIPIALWVVPFGCFFCLAAICFPYRKYGLYVGLVSAVTVGQILLLTADLRPIYNRVIGPWEWAQTRRFDWSNVDDPVLLASIVVLSSLFISAAILSYLQGRRPGSPQIEESAR